MTKKGLNMDDLQKFNYLARLYVRDNNLSALEEARELYKLALNESEQKSIIWWNEGVRDYGKSEEAIRVFVSHLSAE